MSETKFGEKKGYVWYSMRNTFIGTWIFNFLFYFTIDLDLLFWLIFIALTYCIFNTFVTSIIHLTRYKQKAFAITALVFSSIWVLLYLVGFVVGMTMV